MNFVRRLRSCVDCSDDASPASPCPQVSSQSQERARTTSMAQQWEGLRRRPTALVHEEVPACRLAIPAYRHEVATVAPSTLTHLEHASQTVRLVRATLAAASNQKPEIVLTQGESWARQRYARSQAWSRLKRRDEEGLPRPKGLDAFYARYEMDADLATQYRVGNCGQFASLSWRALAAQTINAPVQRTHDAVEDHNYLLIGDPRDPRYGETDTVVVDAWPRYPVACTLAHAKNLNPAPTALVRSVNQAPTPEEIAAFNKVLPVVSSWEINQSLAEEGRPLVGDALLKSIYEEKEEPFFDNRAEAKDPSTRYTDGSGSSKTFDQIDPALIKQQDRATRVFDRFVKRHPEWKNKD